MYTRLAIYQAIQYLNLGSRTAPILADTMQYFDLALLHNSEYSNCFAFLLRATRLNGNLLLVVKHKVTKYVIHICFANKNLFNTCAAWM